ncbi:MAG: substrate-binding domain-containing protein [Pseudomonadota bacterium]
MTVEHVLLAASLAAILPAACKTDGTPASEIILATTTSTQDTGLLDDLVPLFGRESGIRVKAVAVGTGEAIAMGGRGDADVLLVHSRKAEDEFMAKGLGTLRLEVMHNDFVLLGPADDPADVKNTSPGTSPGASSGADRGAGKAFARIAAKGALFVSRGDGSGTHKKEQELWTAAGTNPDGAWYVSTGQGMGETLRMASEKRAYTLADRGTWLAQRNTLDLQIVSEGDSRLANPYGVIVVSPARFPKVNAAAAEAFARWLVAPAVQRRIGDFGVARFGQPLFIPDALLR